MIRHQDQLDRETLSAHQGARARDGDYFGTRSAHDPCPLGELTGSRSAPNRLVDDAAWWPRESASLQIAAGEAISC